jgi:hypothetical protein
MPYCRHLKVIPPLLLFQGLCLPSMLGLTLLPVAPFFCSVYSPTAPAAPSWAPW